MNTLLQLRNCLVTSGELGGELLLLRGHIRDVSRL
jgi:hypothetical protein